MKIPYVMDIQKYCIHDGDGIRTTVFFKGCPLKCTWCHNPESQRYQPELLYNPEKCSGCGACLEACPAAAISRADCRVGTDRQKCTGCGACLDECYQLARDISGRQYSLAELIREVTKDQMFYEQSSGGVTLSGGEVMTQDMDYVEAFVKKLHRRGFDVTIDTCGYAPYENFARVLPYVSTFLYDLKLMDREKHRYYIGTDNEQILDNLRKLSDAGARLYIRVPLIEAVNASDEDIEAMITWLKSGIRVEKINLLPYHNTGQHKYEKLDLDYQGEDYKAPSPERLEQLAEMFRDHGFRKVKIGG